MPSKPSFLRFILLAVLTGWVATAAAQDATVYTPSAYSSTLNNYILEWAGVKPDTAAADFTTGVYLSNARLAAHYYDGLGRPLQTIAKQGSLITGGTATDLITANVYDSFSRETRVYLPFAASSEGGNTHISDGSVTLDPFQQQVWYYSDSNTNSPILGQGETFYYGKTEYEPSPLNRPLRVYEAGNNWVSGSGRGTNYSYWVNTSADSVQIWMVTSGSFGSFGSYSVTGSYTPGELYKNVTTDENGIQTEEFKDRENKVILKKVQLTAATDSGSGSGYTGWLCTYYVYDTTNRLRCVIQPATVTQLPAVSWTLSSTMLSEGCFRYEYDSLGQNIIKKTPGASEVDMIYDGDDRVVMTQDGNLQALHEYLYTQYDSLNRATATGVLTDNSNYNNPNYHRALARASYSYPNLSSYTHTELTHTFYDDYSWLGSYGNPFYSTRSTLWDSYLLTASNTTYPYPQTVTQSSATRGLVTGSRANILGTGNYLYFIKFYDDHYRVIQTQNWNQVQAIDYETTQYSFTGQPLLRVTYNHLAGTDNPQTNTIVTQLIYDSLGRVAQVQKKLGNSVVGNHDVSFTWKTTVQNQYDALGRIAEKSVGNKPGYTAGTPLANQVYAYNIRGWLLSVNKPYVDASTNSDQYFGMELGYDKNASLGTFPTPQYNGNIAGMLWKAEGDQAKRKYDFSYDAGNRLTGANFNQYVSGSGSSATFDKSAGIDYSVNTVGYDPNGNILNLQEKGWKVSSSPTIDSLTYAYLTGSNKLSGVTDGASDTTIRLGDFVDGINTGADYNYDNNGNLIADSNKHISNIVYNYLNLPTTIYFSGKGHITYTYDANGNKLQKIVVDSTYGGSKTTTTNYVGGLVFVNDTLQYLAQEEGRVRLDTTGGTGTFYYDYYLKDHLGNTRMVVTEQSETDAYPDASLEDSTIAEESLYYGSLDSGRINKSTVPGYPNDTYTNPNNYIQELSGATGSYTVGANVVLKVMAGDTVNIRANSWYNNYGSTPGMPTSPLASLVAGLAGGIMEATPLHFNIGALEQPAVLNPGITSFLTTVDSASNTSKPLAFLNWILFDEQFHYVAGSGNMNSGFQQVGADTIFTTHTVTGQVMTKSGYLFVYVSNETPNITVYFDNLQVTHIRGRIVEESHYYPYGLLMAGISAQAAGKPENLYKFNKGSELQHKEFSDGSGLDWYSTELRGLDPQIGRWWQIDSKPTQTESPYASMGNNPILHDDPLGDTSKPGYWAGVAEGFSSWYQSYASQVKFNFQHPVTAIENGLDPKNLKSLLLQSPTANLFDNSKNGVDIVKNLLNGNNYEAGKLAGGQSAEGTFQGLALLTTGGIAKGISLTGGLTPSSTSLFRAVSDEELLDISQNGMRALGGNTYDLGKLFATTPQDAATYGKNNYSNFDQKPFTIIQANMPDKVINASYTGIMDGMRAVSVPSNQLSNANWVVPHNDVPIPMPFGF